MPQWTRENSRAFMPYPDCDVPHAESGPLVGLTFSVKDMFDVAGFPTSAGSPTMLAASGIKTKTACAVQQLLDAGARFIGKAVTDELAFSVIGNNAHFGIPVNGAAPERYAGGSSSGSASSVSCGLCDFSLGTDSGGSVRGPASQCGLFGIRPSFGRISLEGCFGLCPPFDTAGILAADFDVFERATSVLIRKDSQQSKETPQLLIPEDIFELFGPRVIDAVSDALESAQSLWGQAHRVKAATVDLNAVLKAYQALQGREIWKHDGTFIEKYQPTFGPGVKERFAFAKTVHDKDLTEQESLCEQAVRHINGLLADSSVLILPTLPGAGLKLDCSPDDMNAFRSKMSASFYLGELAGVPWITLPLAEIDGAPLGVSLISACGTDAWLLELSKPLVQNR